MVEEWHPVMHDRGDRIRGSSQNRAAFNYLAAVVLPLMAYSGEREIGVSTARHFPAHS